MDKRVQKSRSHKNKDKTFYIALFIIVIAILIITVYKTVTGASTYGTTDLPAPTWSNNLTTGSELTASTETIFFNITPTDTDPDKYIFSFDNGTGTFINDTPASWVSGTVISINKTSFVTSGGDIRWYWTFNDTSGNIKQTRFVSQNMQKSEVVEL